MSKDLYKKLEDFLIKASDYFDDDDSYQDDSFIENEPQFNEEDLGEGFREFDADDEESDGDKWLQENDPTYEKDNYEEYGEDEDEDAHRADAEEYGATFEDPEQLMDQDGDLDIEEDEQPAQTATAKESPIASPKLPDPQQEQTEEPQAQVKGGRFRQPTKEEIISLRGYTRPWAERARDLARLQADPSKNPVLHHYGNLIEARNNAFADRKSAYADFTSSPEYQNADPITQMEMDDKFEADWKTNNPDHLNSAFQSYGDAHSKSKAGYDKFNAEKDAKIRHVLSGGAQSEDAVSLEEALQHAGGMKTDEGTTGTVIQDKASAFANNNQDFIQEYAKNYEQKAKKVGNIDDMQDYNEDSKRDFDRILGPQAGKDPKVEAFFSHYYPLIGMNAHRVMNKLGLDKQSGEVDMSMLHEAGMHGMMQAINDYDHDHHSGASFSTHASNKMRGLMQSALKAQDQIPYEIRQAQKRFTQNKMAQPKVEEQAPQPTQPKITAAEILSSSKHPRAAQMHDSMKRLMVHRNNQGGNTPPTGGSDV